ncbi:MAG: PQQ-binding-like beta-propeller repeat protein [Myxococcota bacterium]
MHKWMATLGLVSTTGTWGSYELTPIDAGGSFDKPPVVSWKVALPVPPLASATHTEQGGPLLHDNHIYVGAAGTDALLVLDRRDGRLIRKLPASAPVQATPVIEAERIYFTDVSGNVWCYAIDGGAPIWEHFSSAPILSSPSIDDDTLYVANVNDQVLALNRHTGELKWRYAHPSDPGRLAELELYGAPPPMPAGDTVLSGFSDGALLALSADSGDPVWSRRVGEGAYPDLIAPPAVREDDILVSGYSEPLVSMDRETQAIRWRRDVGGPHPVVEADGRLLHSGGDGVLRALDAQTGDELWEWDSDTDSALTRPIATEAGLLVGAAAGSVYLIDPKSGEQIWTHDPGYFLAGVTAVPHVAGRQAVVLTNAGNLISFIAPR